MTTQLKKVRVPLPAQQCEGNMIQETSSALSLKVKPTTLRTRSHKRGDIIETKCPVTRCAFETHTHTHTHTFRNVKDHALVTQFQGGRKYTTRKSGCEGGAPLGLFDFGVGLHMDIGGKQICGIHAHASNILSGLLLKPMRLD
jgi:hypothetical protein